MKFSKEKGGLDVVFGRKKCD